MKNILQYILQKKTGRCTTSNTNQSARSALLATQRLLIIVPFAPPPGSLPNPDIVFDGISGIIQPTIRNFTE